MEFMEKNENGEYVYMEVFENGMVRQSQPVNTKGMLSPVRCTHCGKVYDLCDVTPITQFADCTTFKTPCCNRHADDRTWKGIPDIKKL